MGDLIAGKLELGAANLNTFPLKWNQDRVPHDGLCVFPLGSYPFRRMDALSTLGFIHAGLHPRWA
jgi:hypothetical protein